jgi:NADPH-dependent glutamate synthase beta subunit-like oxidoreductase/NAD(P)H-flavin reductase
LGELTLEFGAVFEDLYRREGLVKLDAAFVADLAAANADLHNRFLAARGGSEPLDEKATSNLLIEVAPHLEDFIGRLFGISKEVQALAARHHALAPIYFAKRMFVQRRAFKTIKPEEAEAFDGPALEKEFALLIGEPLTEQSYSKHVTAWIDDKGIDKPGCEAKTALAAKYAAWAYYTHAGQEKHKRGVLFKMPKKLDFYHLVPVETEVVEGVTSIRLSSHHLRHREGFGLTDAGGDLKIALDDANYCIFCHNQGRDSCSKGLKDKPDPATGRAPYKKTPLDILLAGCPLEEKISEMNLLKSQGVSIGALGMVVVDNPMCAGTGHRICNDCMKACVYQKQEPVNIPRTETRTLQDVLELPWGFEVYSLLTRWNPLNLKRPLPKADTGYKVLVSGLGPAGFTLSHHLMNDGHTVVAVDGLKIEPLPREISGITPTGERAAFRPIRSIDELFEPLDERTLAGFGGVAEYGITVRWNKNYLKVIRLLLERREEFAMFGGVRFGSTITYDSAFAMGFDHIALCMGAGKPTVISMPNALARGVRTASDFLMALQLTGAAKKDSIANLQLRMPVVVIGGGLTAIDTATESMAYYPVQVEKFLSRYEILSREYGEQAIRSRWSEEELQIADEFIHHAKAIRAEREKAAKEKRGPDLIHLMKGWGGVKVAYRKRLVDSPSYRLNHEEVEKALEEGIEFVENVNPVGVRLDDFGHARGLRVSASIQLPDGKLESAEKSLPAKSIFMAAGTSPNTVLAREDGKHFKLDGKWFEAIDEDGNHLTPEPSISKPAAPHVLMSKNAAGKYVSFFGDLHPSYVGNVVKAMGSAKQGYPVVSKVLGKTSPSQNVPRGTFLKTMKEQFIAVVHEVVRLTPTIIEVIVKAPLAAKEFQPGQFYRLQNFDNLAPVVGEGKERTKLAMEGLALTGAWVDKEKGLLSTIVLEMGGSSDLCAFLKKGEPIILMGPTGTPTHIAKGETVMLVGGGLGNAVLFSIGKAFREAGSKVLYFAGYKKATDRYKIEEIEAASDVVVWCCDEAELKPGKAGGKTFQGNIVQAISAYAEGKLGEAPISLKDVNRIIAIGSDRMMAAVGQARHTVLKNYLNPEHEAIGSINSPMQCMMKEICAQCLQKHVDPVTGERKYIYSCFNQDQCLDKVSFPHLNERLRQNSVQEKLTALWIDRALKSLGLRKAA